MGAGQNNIAIMISSLGQEATRFDPLLANSVSTKLISDLKY